MQGDQISFSLLIAPLTYIFTEVKAHCFSFHNMHSQTYFKTVILPKNKPEGSGQNTPNMGKLTALNFCVFDNYLVCFLEDNLWAWLPRL